MPHSFFDVPHPTVIGHRGSAGTCPENTLVSFEAALEAGAHILESDVHISRDGVPILLHDPDLDRISDQSGQACDFTWAELQEVDAGYAFEDAGGAHSFRGKNIRIASLEQAFDAFPEARFNLEIKCAGDAAIAATLDLVASQDREHQTLIAAGEDPIMADVRKLLARHSSAPAMGASLGEIVGAVSSALNGEAMPSGVMALQIPSEFAGQPLATRELIDHAHAHAVAVHVWTINDLEEIEALLALGVDGIVTDFPGQMADWLVGRG
ncbi:MAG: glycerophosphodiester phosphodiesterase family protein [Myxococcota bacterium]